MTDRYSPKKHISLLAKDVLDYLKAEALGKENAKKISAVAFRFEKGRREIEHVSEELRSAGIPLCSLVCPPYGLFLARDFAEMKSWCTQIDHRFQAMATNRAMAMRTLKEESQRLGIQLSLDFFK